VSHKKGDMLMHPGAAAAAVIMMFAADTFRVMVLVDSVDRDVFSIIEIFALYLLPARRIMLPANSTFQ
jgi:hypothetical protein